MKNIIFDCDNTFGVKERDVDDGLTFLYLLGREDVNLLGVTTTFGNSTIDIVHDNTIKMLNDLNIKDIPLYKGAGDIHNRHSEAAEFLVNTCRENKGEITILATGSVTNLYGAYEIDKDFFKNVKEIVFMGGITEPLVINNKNLDELNFSCDPIAIYNILKSEAKVTVLTAQICLQAFFGENEFDLLMNSDKKIYSYIKKNTLPWFNFIMSEFGIKGFYNWDIVAAMYITNKELFIDNYVNIISTPDDFKTGFLKKDDLNKKGYKVNIPSKIIDIDRFNKIIFETWGKIQL